MTIILAQISDLHASSTGPSVNRFCKRIADVIAANAQECSAREVVLLFNGDLVNKGAVKDFPLAGAFIRELHDALQTISLVTHVVIVPGNHDCFFNDSNMRSLALKELKAPDLPEQEMLDILLKPLEAYYSFVETLSGMNVVAIDGHHKLHRTHTFTFEDNHSYTFQLLNSAWMSSRHEQPGTLTFPLALLQENVLATEPKFVFSVVHHPLNWFSQPLTMRQLREKLESSSHLVLTGHEHVARFAKMESDGLDPAYYLEGGTLNDPNAKCGFNVVEVRPEESKVKITRYALKNEYFQSDNPLHRPIVYRSLKPNNGLKLSFRNFLTQSEFLFARNGEAPLPLNEFYTTPDLRPLESITAATNKRVKAEHALDRLAENPINLLVGPEKCGRTSFLKMLFRHHHNAGRLPVFIPFELLSTTRARSFLSRCVKKSLARQYESINLDIFAQQAKSDRILLVDDWDRIPYSASDRSELIKQFTDFFGLVVLTSTSNQIPNDVSADDSSISRYEICDFGKVRLRELGKKWIGPGSTPQEKVEKSKRIENVCRSVEQSLRANSMPHHPWILVSLLQLSTADDSTAKKDASYLHLFDAITTVALRNSLPDFDLPSVYTYLAAFAHAVYQTKAPFLDDMSFRRFHSDHRDNYDLPWDFDQFTNALTNGRMLRKEPEGYYFYTRYAFCFFLAWYIARSFADKKGRVERQTIVKELVNSLHQADYADTVLFLAHLTNDSFLLTEMQAIAGSLFTEFPEITMDGDIDFLESLFIRSLNFILPNDNPDANRQLSHERHDELKAESGSKRSDGREVSFESHDTSNERVFEIAKARKTVQILGQILRNQHGGINNEVKDDVVSAIFAIERRLQSAALSSFKEIYERFEPEYLSVTKRKIDGGSLTQSEAELGLLEIRDLFLRLNLFFLFCEAKSVSEAVGLDRLEPAFDRTLAKNPVLSLRIFDLAISLDNFGFPRAKIASIHQATLQNLTAQSILKLLVVHHLYLYDVDFRNKQSVCSLLEIDVPKGSLNSDSKRITS